MNDDIERSVGATAIPSLEPARRSEPSGRGASQGDLSALGADLALDETPARKGARWGVWLLLSICVAGVVALMVVAVGNVLREREAAHERAIDQRLAALAEGRAEVAATWLDGLEATAGRLVQSDLVRLYLAETNVAGAEALEPALEAQRPYMQDALAAFARRNGFIGAALYNRSGALALGWGEAAPRAFVERARNEIVDGGGGVRPVSNWDDRLRVAMAAPIAAPQSDGGDIAGFLAFSVALDGRAASLLARSALGRAEERAFLTAGGSATIGLAVEEPPRAAALAQRTRATNTPGEPSLGDGAAQGVYVASARVRGAPWTVVQEADWAIAREPLDAFRFRTIAAALGFGVLALLFGVALWRHQAAEKQTALAMQYKDLAGRIERQRRLLDAITGAAMDGIALRSRDGAYVYANPAFAEIMGVDASRVIGATDRGLAGDAATMLRRVSVSAERGAATAFEDEVAALPAGDRILSGSASPLDDDRAGGAPAGVVMVVRDVTEMVEERRRRQRMIEQTVEAFVHTIELSDPYLVGHTQRLRRLAVAVGEEFGLGDKENGLLSLAAGLSQLGKTFVPPEIVRKPGRHTAEETAAMQRHVELGLEVLRAIEFDPEILEAYGQMHERLDGSGYPAGVEGDDIAPMARILGCVDVFCARTQPRSYRERIEPMEAIAWLRTNAGRYDVAVVEALGRVVSRGGVDAFEATPPKGEAVERAARAAFAAEAQEA